jgi:DNA/RNA endonuclease YhcR with UshA esterase domain
MNRIVSGILIALGVTLISTPISAHHSFAAEFDIHRPITLKGRLTRMEWVNPHAWIYIDVTNADGTVTNWAIEAGSLNALIRRGLKKTDFPAGAVVEIKGYQAKNGAPRGNGITVTLENGKNFFMGSQGTGAPDAQ